MLREELRSHFYLITRFPDNFVLMKADNQYKAAVVWVTDLELKQDGSGDVTIIGHAFKSMQPSWETSTDNFARFHSYKIGTMHTDRLAFDGSNMIGKGIAVHLKLDVEHPRILNFDQEWVFHLLDHCIPR